MGIKGEGFNYHYQAHGRHPLLCYDNLTGGLPKAELRNGTIHCGKDAGSFMKFLLDEPTADYPDILLYLRGGSGSALPELYEVPEDKDCKYAIRLKENTKLRDLAKEADQSLYRAAKFNQIDHAAGYGEFLYRAGSWNHLRRVIFKIKPYEQMVHLYTFLVTTMEIAPYQVIQLWVLISP